MKGMYIEFNYTKHKADSETITTTQYCTLELIPYGES